MSSIEKPWPISDELCDFLMLPHGSCISRAELNRAILAYIRFIPSPGFKFDGYLTIKQCICSPHIDEDVAEEERKCPLCDDETEREKAATNDKINTQVWGNKLTPGARNLQSTKRDNKCIEPDEKLSKLLRYDEYVADIKSGKITSSRRNKTTGEIEKVTVTDPSLTYFVLPRLLVRHFVRSV